MNDPIPAPAPAPDPAAPAAADAQGVSPDQVRSTLGLPPESSDADVISVLVAIVANLQARYEATLDESVKGEAAIANREFAPFAAKVPAGQHEFWVSNLIVNREATLAALKVFSDTAPSASVPPAPPVPALPAVAGPLPLVNRASAVPAPVNPGLPGDALLAVRIRNRANELAKTGLAWREAFESAAREICCK